MRIWVCWECGRTVKCPDISYYTPNTMCPYGDHVVIMSEVEKPKRIVRKETDNV